MYRIDPKTGLGMMLLIVPTFYTRYTLMGDITNIDDYTNGADIRLNVLRSKKEIVVDGRIVLRGPHMCNKLRETLTNMNIPIRKITYEYVDSIPEPLPYLKSLGIPNEQIPTCLSIIQSNKLE